MEPDFEAAALGLGAINCAVGYSVFLVLPKLFMKWEKGASVGINLAKSTGPQSTQSEGQQQSSQCESSTYQSPSVRSSGHHSSSAQVSSSSEGVSSTQVRAATGHPYSASTGISHADDGRGFVS